MTSGHKTTDEHKADSIFNSAFQGEPNFMTPILIRRGMAGALAYELSMGRDNNGKPDLFGVTVLGGTVTEPIRMHDESKCFTVRGHAEAYIKTLGKAVDQ